MLYAIALVGTIWFFVYFRSRKLMQDKRALEQKVHVRTAEVMQQKEKIEAQRDNLEIAFQQLKTAQTQLIQSEKMASLGELTAGIAHEIQNPLNFVNNFSEVSIELLDELKEEAKAGNSEDVMAIADDLSQNLQKINDHGKRADSIVKGMLQHSQSSSGKMEPTDINALANEYLRLSYHGLRAKDKTFNAEMTTRFDAKLPKINVIPQDIGRVMLNIFNNAFYAVNQQQKTANADYKPEVTVTTTADNGQIIIKVKDNGIGIPNAIKDKIMQPFFTTKPTGEGTGLGLSLTYDMVVKGHGGSIELDSRPGEFTEFIIRLPLTIRLESLSTFT
jgi:two-component system NtrC family sensor kinase